MIRLVAAVLVVVAAFATPATAAGGQGGLAGLRLVYDIGRDTFADDRLVAPVEALGGALAASNFPVDKPASIVGGIIGAIVGIFIGGALGKMVAGPPPKN